MLSKDEINSFMKGGSTEGEDLEDRIENAPYDESFEILSELILFGMLILSLIEN